MTGEANPQKQAKPGDDKVTLPPLLPQLTSHRKGDRPSESERELELSMLAYSVMMYGKENQMTPKQKADLVEAFRYECAKVTDIVREQLRRVQNIGDGERLAYLKDYQALCGRLSEEVERSLDRCAVDDKVVSRLCWEHLNLIDQSNFITQLYTDVLANESIRALACAEQQIVEISVPERPPFGFRPAPKPNRPQYAFRKEGATWRIIYGEYETTVEDLKGVQYIHCLVKNSNTSMECLSIELACSTETSGGGKRVDNEEALEAGLHASTYDLRQLDNWDVKDIEKAIDNLKELLEGADDPSRKAELRKEILALQEYLDKNLNIHGQGRPVGEVEKSRKRVSNTISRAKQSITSHNKDIGAHFESAIRAEQTAFVYKPDRKIDWTLS